MRHVGGGPAVVLGLALLLFASPASPARAEEGKTVALLALDAGQVLDPSQARVLAEQVDTDLAAALQRGAHTFVPQAELIKRARESYVDLGDCDGDLDCTLEVGSELSIDLLLTVQIVRFGDVLVVTLKLLDTDTQTVAARKKVEAKGEIEVFRSLGTWAASLLKTRLPKPQSRPARAQADVLENEASDTDSDDDWLIDEDEDASKTEPAHKVEVARRDEGTSKAEEVWRAVPAERARLDAEQSSPILAERLQRRAGRLFISWTPGLYTYNGTPCSEGTGPCGPPADSALESFDFLKTEINAPAIGSFSVGGEWFPGQEVVGVEAEYSRVSYTTDFATQSGGGESHCDTHFCDSMHYINVGARFRIPLLKDKGPIDLLFGVGPSVQDVTVFWRRPDANGDKEARFETINLVVLRVGVFGLRYTAVPQVQPHFAYNIAFGLRATLGGNSFAVPGIINHNVIGGVTFFPWKGLMLDASYTMLTRSLGLSFEEDGVIQRGTLAEVTHSLRVSAGWAF
jgi:hypothetical protein